jgi:hypothetical protein
MSLGIKLRANVKEYKKNNIEQKDLFATIIARMEKISKSGNTELKVYSNEDAYRFIRNYENLISKYCIDNDIIFFHSELGYYLFGW